MANLRCSELTKIYDNNVAVSDINLDLEFTGLGLLGPNGSGKTTFVNLLLGIINPTLGSIEIDVSRKNFRVVQDQPVLPWKMSVDQWVYTLETMYGENQNDVDIQTDLGLEGHWLLGNLSAGQKRKAALLPIFYGTPELIIIDEPTNYLDINTKQYILKLLKQHCKNTGADMIISSHNVEELRLFSSHVLLLNRGRLLQTISIDEEIPTYYLLKSTNLDALADELSELGILFFEDETIQGRVLKVEATEELWKVIDKFDKKGDHIVHFKTIDSLERMIEDLVQ